MSETEQMLLQTLKRMEENYETRLKECGTRLEELEERQMLLLRKAICLPPSCTAVSAQFEKIVQRCRSGVQQLADLVAEIEKRRIAQERERSSPRIRMR